MAKTTRSSTTTANTDNPETGDTTTPAPEATEPAPAKRDPYDCPGIDKPGCSMKNIAPLDTASLKAMHNRRCGGQDGCGRAIWDPAIGLKNRPKGKPAE